MYPTASTGLLLSLPEKELTDCALLGIEYVLPPVVTLSDREGGG